MNKKTRGSKSPGVLSGSVGGISGSMTRAPNIPQKKAMNITAAHKGAPGKARSKY